MWCTYDAQERKLTFGRDLSIALVLFPMIGFPIYCIKSRGANGIYLMILGYIFAAILGSLSIGSFCVADSYLFSNIDANNAMNYL